jgi:hypothetical protein
VPMSATDVLEVLSILDAEGISAWIGGGWGVDALVGQETRRHEDLDIAVDAKRGAFDDSCAGSLPGLGVPDRVSLLDSCVT